MRGDSHVRFGKGWFRVILAVYFHHYTPNIELAFSSVEYIMRDSAGSSVLVTFLCLTRLAKVFKTLFVKPSTSREQVFYNNHIVLHQPLVTLEYRLCQQEISLSCLKLTIANLSTLFWLLL